MRILRVRKNTILGIHGRNNKKYGRNIRSGGKRIDRKKTGKSNNNTNLPEMLRKNNRPGKKKNTTIQRKRTGKKDA